MPETSLRPSPSARLLACLTCLRLASGPAQPATCHPGSGPSVYETGLAYPATRPSTAQPSPPSPSSSRNQQRSPAARQPATHPWPPSSQPTSHHRPPDYWGNFSGVLKQMEVCIPTMYLSWAEQPSKKCMSWQAASHVKWRCPNTQSWSWLFSDTNYCSPFYGGQAPLKMLIPRKKSCFFQGH